MLTGAGDVTHSSWKLEWRVLWILIYITDFMIQSFFSFGGGVLRRQTFVGMENEGWIKDTRDDALNCRKNSVVFIICFFLLSWSETEWIRNKTTKVLNVKHDFVFFLPSRWLANTGDYDTVWMFCILYNKVLWLMRSSSFILQSSFSFLYSKRQKSLK